jgi:ABC-type spermidine/putrescine transport system permease subunit II
MRSASRLGLFALVLAIVLPLATLVATAFGTSWFYPALLPSAWTTEGWTAIAHGRLGPALATSIIVGLLVAGLATAIALPIGRAIARAGGATARIGTAAAFLPIAVPPIALATGLQLGALQLGLGGTTLGVVLAHAVPTIGYLTLFFLGVFRGVDAALEESARTLGLSPASTWRHVMLPLLRRPLSEAMLLGFLVSWAQVPLTLVIGGGTVRTLATELMAYVQAGQDRLAAVAALLLLAPAVLALEASRRLARTTGTVAG